MIYSCKALIHLADYPEMRDEMKKLEGVELFMRHFVNQQSEHMKLVKRENKRKAAWDHTALICKNLRHKIEALEGNIAELESAVDYEEVEKKEDFKLKAEQAKKDLRIAEKRDEEVVAKYDAVAKILDVSCEKVRRYMYRNAKGKKKKCLLNSHRCFAPFHSSPPAPHQVNSFLVGLCLLCDCDTKNQLLVLELLNDAGVSYAVAHSASEAAAEGGGVTATLLLEEANRSEKVRDYLFYFSGSSARHSRSHTLSLSLSTLASLLRCLDIAGTLDSAYNFGRAKDPVALSSPCRMLVPRRGN